MGRLDDQKLMILPVIMKRCDKAWSADLVGAKVCQGEILKSSN